MSTTPSRPREHPETRFAPPEEAFDMGRESLDLMGEQLSGQHGHRQKALIREGPLTAALYVFEPGAALPDHTVDGVVLIQVLDGRMTVQTETSRHELAAGQMLRLSRGVRHDVAAVEPSRMLLIVALEGGGSHP